MSRRGNLYYWVANWNLSHAQAAILIGRNAVFMADATHSNVAHLRASYPVIKRFAAYITGTPDIAWTTSDFEQFPHDCAFLLIDQSDRNLPLFSHVKKVVKDEESGASTVGMAVSVAHERISRGEDYIIYCAQGDLREVEDLAARNGLPPGRIIAYQFASPSSNPDTYLPGAYMTLREANVDLSIIDSTFLPLPGVVLHKKHAPKKVAKKVGNTAKPAKPVKTRLPSVHAPSGTVYNDIAIAISAIIAILKAFGVL